MVVLPVVLDKMVEMEVIMAPLMGKMVVIIIPLVVMTVEPQMILKKQILIVLYPPNWNSDIILKEKIGIL